MLGGAARQFASDSRVFLGSHPESSDPPDIPIKQWLALGGGFRRTPEGVPPRPSGIQRGIHSRNPPAHRQDDLPMTLSFAPDAIETWPLAGSSPMRGTPRRTARTRSRRSRARMARVRLDGARAGGGRRRTDRRPRPHPRRRAARADRGAGDRARTSDRGAAPRLPSGGQPAGRSHRGTRRCSPASCRSWRPTISTCRWSASPTRNSTSCSRSMRVTRATAATERTSPKRRRPRSAVPAISGCSGRTGCSAGTPRSWPTSTG